MGMQGDTRALAVSKRVALHLWAACGGGGGVTVHSQISVEHDDEMQCGVRGREHEAEGEEWGGLQRLGKEGQREQVKGGDVDKDKSGG